ncbi:L-cystine transporter-like protein [Trichodelitschia bisporula]|uniref:L-cystine transporter-like protein n=1 Tax=Trichodelitschia bisporula TaxID=703511 RepID=A0A6G1HUL1_9PEZI|nr:L-cystine transporter-like protein [Trichodelitschia bisporula]
MPSALEIISSVLGWTYFLCWSVSFYPQPLLNFRRRSTHGLAIDFPTLNVLGFGAYSITTLAFFYSPTIRSQYAFRHPASPEPTVRFNDVAFALHAFVLCVITYSQFFRWIWGFAVGARQRATLPTLLILWGSLGAMVGVVTVVGFAPGAGNDPRTWAWLDVIYALGYVKLACTVVKYCPQAYFNYKRKSTVGWSIGQILLDFSGGILSLLQLVIDSSMQGDWSGIAGNPVKLGLSNISVVFDVIFITQHYILYHGATNEDEEDKGWVGERSPLVGDRGDAEI